MLKIIAAIKENKDYLSELDGLIGDGDHGTNMNKGFTMFEDQINDRDIGFSAGLDELGNLLFTKIGGSMGPIYGSFFMGMAEAGSMEKIDLVSFAAMMDAGISSLDGIVEAKTGDKTLMDTLLPAAGSLHNSINEGKTFSLALDEMKTAAEIGMNATKDLISKFGRSSRLGERSRGVLDAGSVSCFFILSAMSSGIKEVITAAS